MQLINEHKFGIKRNYYKAKNYVQINIKINLSREQPTFFVSSDAPSFST